MSVLSSAEKRMAEKLEERGNENSLRKLISPDSSFIDFCSNDYLGLARSENLLRLVEEEWRKLKSQKTTQLLGSGGSRLLAGNSSYAENLENELAQFYKGESGLFFNSGYAANAGIFSSIPKRGDTILFDELIHASVRDGIKMSQAKSWSFHHNDLSHLEELLKKAEGTIFVAAEAIYSMDGDECLLEEMVLLCEKYGAAFILDEAHSNGIYGENGEGLAVQKNMHERIFARLFTFGKAAGCHGAIVVGSEVMKNYLINFSRPFIYTTALPVHDLAVIKCAVNHFSGQKDLRKQLFSFVNYFRKKVGEYSSIQLLPSESAIQGILIGGNDKTRSVAAKCRENKMDVRAILSPTVPEGKERLRIIIHTFNHPLEMDELIKLIAEASKN
jgi:8-amino-7-oxononanoate synthase